MAGFDAWISLDTPSNITLTSVVISGTYGPDSNGYDIQSPATLSYGVKEYTDILIPIADGKFRYELTGLTDFGSFYVRVSGWNGLKTSYSETIEIFLTDESLRSGGLLLFE